MRICDKLYGFTNGTESGREKERKRERESERKREINGDSIKKGRDSNISLMLDRCSSTYLACVSDDLKKNMEKKNRNTNYGAHLRGGKKRSSP